MAAIQGSCSKSYYLEHNFERNKLELIMERCIKNLQNSVVLQSSQNMDVGRA
jgi:hypothetical protein